MNIKLIQLIVNDGEPRTFNTTDEVRTYLNALDDAAGLLHPQAEAEASVPVMLPSVTPITVPQPGNFSLEDREEDQQVAPDPAPTPRTRRGGSRNATEEQALDVWHRIKKTLAPGEVMKSSRFKRALIVETDCTLSAAQSWVWKLNKDHNAGIYLDRERI